MADRQEVIVKDEAFGVDLQPLEGNSRRFMVSSIPLSCTVSREGKPSCSDLFYSVSAPIPISIPGQELYTPAEYHESLSDESMLRHARFVIGIWQNQPEEIPNS